MRITQSFSLDLRTIEKLKAMEDEYKDCGKSRFVDDLIYREWLSWAEKQDPTGQTTLEIHYAPLEQRVFPNGTGDKCNPMLKDKPCPTCWPQGWKK
jgi:hypothetical protein